MNHKKIVNIRVTPRAGVWIPVFIAMLLASCAGLAPRMEPPTVTVVDVGLGSASLFEQQFNLTLRIQNPNPQDITIDGMAFDLEINDQPFAKGVANQTVTLPRYGSALVPVEAVSSLGGLVAQIRALARAGRPAFKYRIKGRLSLNGTSVPFDRRGGVDWDLPGPKI